MMVRLRKVRREGRTQSQANETSVLNDDIVAPSAIDRELTAPTFKGPRQLEFERIFAVGPRNTATDSAPEQQQQQSENQGRFADIRQWLARKASTFSRRSKIKRRANWSSDPQTLQERTFIAFENEFEAYTSGQNPYHIATLGRAASDITSAPYPPPLSLDRSNTFSYPCHRYTYHPSNYVAYSRPGTVNLETVQTPIRSQQLQLSVGDYFYIDYDRSGRTSCETMASEQAPPPVPYERLRQLTTEVRLDKMQSTSQVSAR